MHPAEPTVALFQHKQHAFMSGGSTFPELKQVLWYRLLQDTTRALNLDTPAQLYLLDQYVAHTRCVQHIRTQFAERADRFIEMAWIMYAEAVKQAPNHELPVIADLVCSDDAMPVQFIYSTP
jgi:hypothetical protein